VSPASGGSARADGEARAPPRHATDGADASRRGTDASGEERAMPAWAHGEWRLLHAPVSRSPASGPEGHALPQQIDAEGHQLLPRNATAPVGGRAGWGTGVDEDLPRDQFAWLK